MSLPAFSRQDPLVKHLTRVQDARLVWLQHHRESVAVEWARAFAEYVLRYRSSAPLYEQPNEVLAGVFPEAEDGSSR